MLRVLTIPGVWDIQEPEQFVRFSRKNPFVEWGIRVKNPLQAEAHFPTVEWMESLAAVADADTRLALHLEGDIAREFMVGNMVIWDYISEKLWAHIRRVHIPLDTLLTSDIEFDIDTPDMADLIHSRKFQDHKQGFRCVTMQVKSEEAISIVWRATDYIDDLYPLFDLEDQQNPPKQWPVAVFPRCKDGALRAHGYAANLSRDIVVKNIESIREAANGGPFWLQTRTVFVNGKVGFGILNNIAEPLHPHYRSGCCREMGSPVRVQYVKFNEKEWRQ